jgi:drug/metabolite transporter (DMT)-like permease
MKYHTYYYALLSGCLGASASCFAKLAFDTTTTTTTTLRGRSASSDGNVVHAYDAVNVCHHLIGSTSATTPKATETLSSKILWNDPNVLCEWSIFVLYRCICLVGMIVCNIYMIGTFLKGMDESGTIAGTALSTASNFIVSAMYGYYIWEERHTIHWWFGFAMVGTGMTILTQCCSTKATNQENVTSKDHVKNE